LLAASRAYVAWTGGFDHVRIVDTADPQRRIEVNLSPRVNMGASLVIGHFDGDLLVVSCTKKHDIHRRDLSVNSRKIGAVRPSLAGVDARKGKLLWQAVADPEQSSIPFRVARPEFSAAHVAVICRPEPISKTARWRLLDRAGGQVVQQGQYDDMPNLTPEQEKTIKNRCLGLGSPVITDDRMVVEDELGITLLGGGQRP